MMKINHSQKKRKCLASISICLLFSVTALYASDDQMEQQKKDAFVAELSVLGASFMQRVASTLCREDEDLLDVCKALEKKYAPGEPSYLCVSMEKGIHKKYERCQQLAQWQEYNACIAHIVYRDMIDRPSCKQYGRKKSSQRRFRRLFEDISTLVVEKLGAYELALEQEHNHKALKQLHSDFDVILKTNVLVLALLEKHFERKARGVR